MVSIHPLHCPPANSADPLQTGPVQPGAAARSRGAIGLEALSIYFDTARSRTIALEGIDLEIDAGEFVALLGPSGCGKTTLLNAIAGFVTPTSGRVVVDGRPVRGPGPERAVVFQQHSLFPWMTALENVAFGPRMLGLPDPVAAAWSYLDLVGLGAHAQQYPAQLSGGMRQRVGLARALAVQPPVLLMDEPFGALDAQTRLLMQEQLLDLWGRSQNTVVFVTHDIDEAIFLADRIVVLGVKPSVVRGIFPVDLPRPRRLETRRSEAYLELQERLFALIREESLKSFDTAGK